MSSDEEEETVGLSVHRGNVIRGNSEKVAVWKPRIEALEEISPAGALMLHFQTPVLWKDKFLLFKLPTDILFHPPPLSEPMQYAFVYYLLSFSFFPSLIYQMYLSVSSLYILVCSPSAALLRLPWSFCDFCISLLYDILLNS
jgi:hypothetical protein